MKSKNTTKWIGFLLVALLTSTLLWGFSAAISPTAEISISQLAQEIKDGNIAEIIVDTNGRTVTITYQTASSIETTANISESSSLEEQLTTYGVTLDSNSENNPTIIYNTPSQWSNWFSTIALFLPVLLLIGFFYFMMRQTQGANNQSLSFGKSKARLFIGDHPTITFNDVAGAEEAKEDLKEVVEFLQEPQKFISFGARIPKGVLMIGSPGTGKTLLAKAVSGEAGVPFFSIAGSEFVEMFVGVGASRVRDLFEQAKQHSPCIIFIDEIDAVSRHRGAGVGGSHDEREQTLNQILVEMDGFDTDVAIIILAATNRPDILDPALMRPGRFDRRVIIDRPDYKGREQIFNVHMRGKPVSATIDIAILAKSTPGFVGADIENTVNEAALLAARRNCKSIGMAEFHEAIERVQLGPERKSRVITPAEREIIAYHEAGHALVSHFIPAALPLRKVTIIPRGMGLGITWYMEDDTVLPNKSQMEAQIATALGGRVAEEIVFGEITAGASNDLQHVTKRARAMVTQYGMSKKLGLRVYGQKQEMVFLGREISEQRDYSDAVAELIDQEVRAIIDREYTHAQQILTDNRDKLDLIAEKLLDTETLEADAFVALVEGREWSPTETGKERPSSRKPSPQADNKGWPSPPATSPA